MNNQALKRYHILIDTCSLMHNHAFDYFERSKNQFIDSGRNIIVTDAVEKELFGLSKSKEERVRTQALRGIELVEYMVENGFCKKFPDAKGFKGDGRADNVLQAIVTHFRTQHNLCIITQDYRLMKDLLKINNSESIKSVKKIVVYKIRERSKKGTLIEFFSTKKPKSIDNIKPFKNSRVPVNESYYDPIEVSSVPQIGDVVYTDKGYQLRLIEHMASGGEGDIYRIESNDQKDESGKYVCKIYKRGKITRSRIDKIELMISNESLKGVPRVSIPDKLVHNPKGEPIGFTMKIAKGYELRRSLMIKKLLIEKLGDTWTRRHLVKTCQNIIRTISILHRYNIIMGDISPGNIMVDENCNVSFIDTDSYQIENYPCPVGTATFTRPENLRKDTRTYLRTKEDDYFAVATLLFMILLPGFAPYSYRGGSDPAANVKARKFVFPFKDGDIYHKSNRDEIAEGTWRYIWSHLPHDIKKAFYYLFAKGEQVKVETTVDIVELYKAKKQLENIDGKEGQIDSIKEEINKEEGWDSLLNKYIYMLDKGWTTNEIFPDDFKHVDEDRLEKYK